MRSKAAKGSRTFSQAQLEQQAKFALFIRFLRPLADLLEITFKPFAVQMSGINAALSYALKNAVAGSYPNYSIDYNRVLISRGDLANADSIVVRHPLISFINNPQFPVPLVIVVLAYLAGWFLLILTAAQSQSRGNNHDVTDY